MKGETAVAKWGEKAKSGAIEVVLKPGVKAPSKNKPSTFKTKEGDIHVTNVTLTTDDNSNNSVGQTKASQDYGMIFTKTEVPPQFAGGTKAWRLFLEKNIKALTPLNNGAPKGTYTVIVQFIVNVDGTLEDIKSLTSLGYGMEEEVLRLIKLSPPWIPAMQNDKKVKAYHKQPITFIVAE